MYIAWCNMDGREEEKFYIPHKQWIRAATQEQLNNYHLHKKNPYLSVKRCPEIEVTSLWTGKKMNDV